MQEIVPKRRAIGAMGKKTEEKKNRGTKGPGEAGMGNLMGEQGVLERKERAWRQTPGKDPQRGGQ